ncbi:MAG: NAD-dependent epimerase/dehydratase family protein [Bacteriovoracaceae bacterium]|nr:NAD-dependent epimerase/dehydratase family protein [Bacteriovoracaceae bacterium]
MTAEKKELKILIIGMAGGLAQLTSRLILKNNPHAKILGIDSRDLSQCPKLKGIEYMRMKYSRGNFENIFRSFEFDIVFHLARVSHSSNKNDDVSKRLDLNLMGTNRILSLCLSFKVKKLIILSTYHVYGSLPDNFVFIPENSPLQASIHYPELRDVVEMDQLCTGWMWKNQKEMSTVVLRPCNIIGTQIQNAITKYLTGRLTLNPVDFNPMFQFIHEFDMASILERAIEELPTGVYNVAPNDFISIKEALEQVQGQSIPFPVSLGKPINKLLKFFGMDVPDYFIDYLKYSCLIDNQAIKKHLGEKFYRYNVRETLDLISMR